MERLNANARLAALREQCMHHQVVDDLHRAVSGFRASAMESEGEQRRIFLGRAQELAGMEQRIVEQAAVVSQSEHRINEECAAICQQQRVQGLESSQELDQLKSERDRKHMSFVEATKDAGALRRELVLKDKLISKLQLSLEHANSAPSVGSWQAINSPDDMMTAKRRGCVRRSNIWRSLITPLKVRIRP